MQRRGFLDSAVVLLVAVLAVPFTTSAQQSAELREVAQATKTWRIGILALGSAAAVAPFMDAFRRAERVIE